MNTYELKIYTKSSIEPYISYIECDEQSLESCLRYINSNGKLAQHKNKYIFIPSMEICRIETDFIEKIQVNVEVVE